MVLHQGHITSGTPIYVGTVVVTILQPYTIPYTVGRNVILVCFYFLTNKLQGTKFFLRSQQVLT